MAGKSKGERELKNIAGWEVEVKPLAMHFDKHKEATAIVGASRHISKQFSAAPVHVIYCNMHIANIDCKGEEAEQIQQVKMLMNFQAQNLMPAD